VSFITMTSLWRHLSTINTATLPLKAFRKEQRSVIHFLWAKRRCPNTSRTHPSIFACYSSPRGAMHSLYTWTTLHLPLPSSSAFEFRPGWPVGCSLVVVVKTSPDRVKVGNCPSTCPILFWTHSVTGQTQLPREDSSINWLLRPCYSACRLISF